MPKIVFTQTLKESTWNNTTLAKGNLAEEIARLKNQNGKDIMTIFNSLGGIRKFRPIQSKLFPGGKTILIFKPKND